MISTLFVLLGTLFVLYILPFIICILYVRYDKEDTDTGRKVVLGMMWIPVINMGYAICIIVGTLMHFLKSEKLYNFIRYGKSS